MSQEILLLVEKCAHCISWYDPGSGERLRTLPLPDFPHEFVVDAAGRYAYVGHYGVETSGHVGPGGSAVLQIDIAAAKLVRSIDLYPFNRIHGMQMDKRGRLYALSEEKSTLLVLEDPATEDAPRRAVPSGGIKSHLFSLAADGETAFSMNLLSHTVTKLRPWEPLHQAVACHPGLKPEGCCLSEDERTLYVSNRWSNTLSAIDTETMTVRLSKPSREDATRIYRLGNRLLVTNYGDRSLSVVDAETLEETACVKMDARAIALSLHPAKPLAYVSQDDDRVGVLNLDTLRFDRYLSTQREPDVSRIVYL